MSDQIDRTVLPIRRPPFRGVANKTLGGSEPAPHPDGNDEHAHAHQAHAARGINA
jgi:hypothetical protein